MLFLISSNVKQKPKRISCKTPEVKKKNNNNKKNWKQMAKRQKKNAEMK